MGSETHQGLSNGEVGGAFRLRSTHLPQGERVADPHHLRD